MSSASAAPISPSRSCDRTCATASADRVDGAAAAAGDVEAEEEIRIEDEQDTEVEPVRTIPDPGKPTAREIELHRMTHLPFRLWCRWCVLGRGRGLYHKKSDGSLIPIIGMDYFFLTRGGPKTGKELLEELDGGTYGSAEGIEKIRTARGKGEIVKCILIRCSTSKIVMAHVIPQKGNDEDNYAANLVVQALEWLGHTRVILKSDGEPAMQALVKRAMELAKISAQDFHQITKEDSIAYDSQSNGSTETGIRIIRGLFRSVKLCFEARVARTVPITHAIIPWMLQHVCMLLNVMVKGTDGLSAWARVRGRPFHQQLLNFGESVLFQFPKKGPHSMPDGNMGSKGSDGIFVGHRLLKNAYVIIGNDGKQVFETRSLTRRIEAERWDADALERMQITPWSEAQRQGPRVAFDTPGEATGQPTTDGVRADAMRRLRIEKADLDEHGYDEDCPQCRYIRRYGQARKGGKHSERCRLRVTEALAGTEAGRARVEAQERRINEGIAEHIEQAEGKSLEIGE